MTISDRLTYIIDNRYETNKSAFAKAVGITPTTLGNYFSKERPSKPSSDVTVDENNEEKE